MATTIVRRVLQRIQAERLLSASDDATANTSSSASTTAGDSGAASSVAASSSPLDSLAVSNTRVGHAERTEAVLEIKLLRPAASTSTGSAPGAAASTEPIVLWSGLQSLVQSEEDIPSIEAALYDQLRAAV